MKRWKIVLPLAAILFAGCVLFYSNTDPTTEGTGGTDGLSGTLVDVQGIPVANAMVKAFVPDTTDTSLAVTDATDSLSDGAVDSTTTNEAGHFRFSNLRKGDYHIVSKFRRGDSLLVVSNRDVHYQDSKDLGQDTIKPPGIILIRARWKENPLRGVRCSVIGAAAAAVSDDSGRCLLADVAPGTFHIRMLKEGYFPVITGEVRVRSDKITYADRVEMASIPLVQDCWNVKQSNGYTGVLKLEKSGNLLAGTVEWISLSNGQHYPSVVAGIDSVTRIYFQAHPPTDSTITGYYWADVRADSLVNGYTKTNQGDKATWFAGRTFCKD